MKKNIFEVPILFIVFTRLETTILVFDTIKKIKPSRFYIASDGPRANKNEEERVKKVRDYILANIDWNCEVKTKFEPTNLGCKYNVQSAISWFFDSEEYGIILEDDVVPSPSFFPYCEELLTRYKNDLRVWGISGTNMLNTAPITDSYYFSDYFMIWGWASWRSRWQKHEKQLKDFHEFANEPLIQKKISNKTANKKMISNAVIAYRDELDTWDYQWIFSCFCNNGLIATPKSNLVENIGFGEGATHTGNKFSLGKKSTNMEFPLNHPKIITTNTEIDERFYTEVFGWMSSFKKIRSKGYLLKYLKTKFSHNK